MRTASGRRAPRRSGPRRSARRSRGRRPGRRAARRRRRRARTAGSRCPAAALTCSSTAPISSVSRWSRPDDGSSRNSSVRVAHEGPGQLDQPAGAEAERAGRAVGDGGEADQLEDRVAPSPAPRPSAPTPEQVAPERRRPRWARSATSRWSRTDRPPNSSMRWKVRARPSRARSCGGRPARSWPCIVTRPRSGRMRPDRQLNSVVLPAPFGPISATSSPGSQVHRHVDQRGDALEALADVLGDEHGLAGQRRRRVGLGGVTGRLDAGVGRGCRPRRSSASRSRRRRRPARGRSPPPARRACRPASVDAQQRPADARGRLGLDDALGVLGVGERTEAEEDERDAERPLGLDELEDRLREAASRRGCWRGSCRARRTAARAAAGRRRT